MEVFMKKQVLLVEDNQVTVDVMRMELEFLGYEVAVARNGMEALDIATSQVPDLIVMDIHMPKMDGLQATSLLRDNPKTRAVPILAATAKALPGEKEKCLASGCNDYLAKPFTHHELSAAIKRLLGE
jgi:CheY-like chemotaxis protein